MSELVELLVSSLSSVLIASVGLVGVWLGSSFSKNNEALARDAALLSELFERKSKLYVDYLSCAQKLEDNARVANAENANSRRLSELRDEHYKLRSLTFAVRLTSPLSVWSECETFERDMHDFIQKLERQGSGGAIVLGESGHLRKIVNLMAADTWRLEQSENSKAYRNSSPIAEAKP